MNCQVWSIFSKDKSAKSYYVCIYFIYPKSISNTEINTTNLWNNIRSVYKSKYELDCLKQKRDACLIWT